MLDAPHKKITHINSSQLLPAAVLIGVIASSFYVFEYILRIMPAAMTDGLMSHFHIQSVGLGFLSALFFYAYAPMQIPAGILVDRLGPKRVLTCGLLFAAIGMLAFCHTDNYTVALTSRLLMGFASSVAFVGALKIGANWYGPKRFAMYTGLVQLFGCVGAIIGTSPFSFCSMHYGWQNTGDVLVLLGLGFALAMWLIVRDHPLSPDMASDEKARPAHNHFLRDIRETLSEQQNWAAALHGFAIWCPVTIFPALWGSSFFQYGYHFTHLNATLMVSMIWVGLAAGGPTLGWWSNHIQRRRLPMFLAGLLGLFCALTIIYGMPHNIALLLLLLFGYGFACGAQSLSFGLIIDNNPGQRIATASGMTNMTIIMSAVVMQPLVSYLLTKDWHSKFTVSGVPLYSLADYHQALSLIPAGFALAMLIALFWIRETHCHHRSATEIAVTLDPR